jgi:hypothetical protein
MTRRELVSARNDDRVVDRRDVDRRDVDRRDVRRDSPGQFNQGQFKEPDDVGRSLSQDRRQRASTQLKPGHGDPGNQPRH